MAEANERLKVPGILIERQGELYAALEPSEVEEEKARPELFFHTAYWRLLIRRGESWDDAGYAASQTESGRGFLVRRVMTTIGMLDGKVVDEFSFRMTHDPLPQLSGRTATESIDADDPVVARLRGICREIANSVTNAQQSSQVLHAFSSGAEYVIEMKDGFDYSDYYIPVMPGQDPQEIIARETSGGMQRFMGILSRERAAQIWPELAAQGGSPSSEAAAAPAVTPHGRSTAAHGLSWLGHVRRALLLALAWAVAWAPLGVLAGMIFDADGAMDEPWAAIGAYPGFLAALVFAVVLGFAYGRPRLYELSPARAAALGALSGLIVIAMPAVGLLGSASSGYAQWRVPLAVMGAVTLLSAASATASALLAGRAKDRKVRGAGGHDP